MTTVLLRSASPFQYCASTSRRRGNTPEPVCQLLLFTLLSAKTSLVYIPECPCPQNFVVYFRTPLYFSLRIALFILQHLALLFLILAKHLNFLPRISRHSDTLNSQLSSTVYFFYFGIKHILVLSHIFLLVFCLLLFSFSLFSVASSR